MPGRKTKAQIKGSPLPCPECGSQIPPEQWNPPEGVPSCSKCKIRLGWSRNEPHRLNVIAQVVEEGDLKPPSEAKSPHQRMEETGRIGALVDALDKDFPAATKDQQHRATIRNLKAFQPTLRKVNKHLRPLDYCPQGGAEGIAEILCGAQLLAERRIKVGKDAEKSEFKMEKYGTLAGTPTGLPFEAVKLKKVLKREQRIHGKFVRKSQMILKALDDYRVFLESLPTLVFSTQDLEGLIRDLDTVMASIKRDCEDEPQLHGTRLQYPQVPRPHNLAAVQIFKLLWAEVSKERALGDTVPLLEITFPDAPVNEDSIWVAYFRDEHRRS